MNINADLISIDKPRQGRTVGRRRHYRPTYCCTFCFYRNGTGCEVVKRNRNKYFNNSTRKSLLFTIHIKPFSHVAICLFVLAYLYIIKNTHGIKLEIITSFLQGETLDWSCWICDCKSLHWRRPRIVFNNLSLTFNYHNMCHGRWAIFDGSIGQRKMNHKINLIKTSIELFPSLNHASAILNAIVSLINLLE